MTDILKDLAAPFPPDVVSWRVGATTKDKAKGMALAYIDSRDVQDRLDKVCGIDWQVRFPWCVGERMTCEIGIRLVHPTRGGEYEWIWRGDGAGSSDVEADKGAFSDAFKRAAVRWGIGRYLYDMESPWVELKAAGNSYVIADHERERLRKLLAEKLRQHHQQIGVQAIAAHQAKVEAALPAPRSLDPKAEAEMIARHLKTAPTLHVLDQSMDDHRERIAKLPKVTQNYLTQLYEKRREAMESVT